MNLLHAKTSLLEFGRRAKIITFFFPALQLGLQVSCKFSYDETETLENVVSPNACQKACELHTNCYNFLYNTDYTKLCRILHNFTLTCDFVLGPSAPVHLECLDHHYRPFALSPVTSKFCFVLNFYI